MFKIRRKKVEKIERKCGEDEKARIFALIVWYHNEKEKQGETQRGCNQEEKYET